MYSRRANLDIQLLNSFLAVTASGSFAAAAESLALTSAAVSGHIKRLEQLTGTRLLARTTRSVRLTPEGELLLSYARNIVDLEREARRRLQGDEIEGRIRIGSTEDFAGALLPKMLKSFYHRHPMASVELRVGQTSHLIAQMEAGELELVFGTTADGFPELPSIGFFAFSRDNNLSVQTLISDVKTLGSKGRFRAEVDPGSWTGA